MNRAILRTNAHPDYDYPYVLEIGKIDGDRILAVPRNAKKHQMGRNASGLFRTEEMSGFDPRVVALVKKAITLARLQVEVYCLNIHRQGYLQDARAIDLKPYAGMLASDCRRKNGFADAVYGDCLAETIEEELTRLTEEARP